MNDYTDLAKGINLQLRNNKFLNYPNFKKIFNRTCGKQIYAEFEIVSNRQNIGDIIIFDDITQNQFLDLAKHILSIENEEKYLFEYLKSTDSRGYAITKKTK